MSQINLRITLDDDPKDPTDDNYEYDYKRIAIASLIIMLILAGLVSWILSVDENPETSKPEEHGQALFSGFEAEKSLIERPATAPGSRANTPEPFRVTKVKTEGASSTKEDTSKTKKDASAVEKRTEKAAPLAEKEAKIALATPDINADTDINKSREEVIEPETTTKGANIRDPRTKRAELTWEVNNLEPGAAVDPRVRFSEDESTKKIVFFTELKNMAGQHFFYEWTLNDKPVAKIKVNVGSERWRSYSSKNLRSSLSGDWKVSAIDAQGNILAEKSFTVATE